MSRHPKFCRYKCRKGKLCCWLCNKQVPGKDKPCSVPCTRSCGVLAAHYIGQFAASITGPKGRQVKITYAAITNKRGKISHGVDPKWRDRLGVVLARGKGPGPKNILVHTDAGRVVVPYGNVRWV